MAGAPAATAVALLTPDVPTKAPKVLGLDLSTTKPGIAGDGWADTLTAPTRVGGWRKRRDPADEAQVRVGFRHHRIQWVRTALADFWPGTALVVMEGLAFDSHDTDRQGAGLSWLIRHDLWRRGIPYVTVPPSTLKQFVTGNGVASKALMRESVAGWFPWFDGDDNAADAAGLWAMGAARLGFPAGPVQPHQVTALDAVQWPAVAA